ncbi:MAG: hypothetical protein AB1726_12690 [Planctomycetota bacterium]
MTRPLRLVAVLLGSLLAGACGEGSATVEFRSENAVATSGPGLAAPSVVPRVTQHAQLAIRHYGRRVVESCDWSGDTPHTTRFREDITSDGEGRYAIEPIEEIEGAIPDWPLFRLMQLARQGMVHRYRDAAVRDTMLFAANWQLTDLGLQSMIAGRRCDLYAMSRTVGTARSYTLSIDQETGLILRYAEKDSLGRLLSRVEYESVDYDPDLGGVVWYEEDEREQLDLQGDLAAQLGFVPLLPDLVPLGYALRQAQQVEVGDERWLNLVYSDGVDTLFFVQSFPPLAPRQGAGAGGPGDLHAAGASDRVAILPIGSARAAQGRVSGRGIIAVGKVAEAELLDLIESALN